MAASGMEFDSSSEGGREMDVQPSVGVHLVGCCSLAGGLVRWVGGSDCSKPFLHPHKRGPGIEPRFLRAEVQ